MSHCRRGACQATPACPWSPRRIIFRLQSNGDKRLKDRVPRNKPGAEPGDSITQICLHLENEEREGGQFASTERTWGKEL